MTAELVFYGLFSYVASQIAASLLKKDPEQPLVEDKPGTSSMRGSWVPLLIGRRRIGPVIAWVGDRVTTTESGGSGGKGSGGGSVQQTVYFERAWHLLAVGPARKLRKVWVNGKLAWSSAGITPESHPSGSTISMDDHQGSFTIYWGHVDQPVDALLSDPSRVGVPSCWPNCCWVRLNDFRLGGFAVWPLVEYELEVHPYRKGDTANADYSTLDPRLSNSADWYKNQHGVKTPWREILDVQAGSPTWIKVQDADGTVAADFTDDSRCRIRFQPVDYVNGDYIVDTAVWNSGESIVVLDGTYADATGYNKNVTAWTLDSSNTLAVQTRAGLLYPEVPTGYAVQDRYLVQSGSDLATPGAVRYDMTGAGNTFSPGASRLRIWVHGLGLAGDIYGLGRPPSQSVTLGFVGRSGAITHQHSSVFSIDAGGTVAIQNINGAIGKLLLDYGDWKLFQVEYVAGAGTDPSSSSYERDIFVGWEPDAALGLFTYLDAAASEYLVDEDDGTTVVGVTQITLKQPLVDLQPQLGDVAPLQVGLGPAEGANPAHVLHQLLFAPWPHGRGLDQEEWDIDSLEDVGVALGDTGEGYRCHIIGLDGQSSEGLIAAIMEDCGIAIAWDVSVGKYRFEIVRKESLASVPQIPAQAILDPLPEIRTRHTAKTATAISFGFPSIGESYRDGVVTFVDDGEALRRQVQVRSNVPIRTVTDSESASQAGLRRAQMELASPTAYRISSAWESRKLWVGRAVRIVGLESRGIAADQVLRIGEVQIDPKTSKVVLTVAADVYGIVTVSQGGASPISSPGSSWSPSFANDFEEPGPPSAPSQDQAGSIHELSAFVSPETIAFVVPRIRGSRDVSGADIHLSTDGFTYRMLGRQQVYAGGGALLEDLPVGSWMLDQGPVFHDDSGDTAQFAESLSDAEWASGRMVAVVGNEVMFPAQVQALGGSLWRLLRVLRGRYEFGQQSHVRGDELYLFRLDRTPAWRDIMLSPSRSIWVKVQPIGGTALPLDSIEPLTASIVGRPRVPMSPSNFRTSKLSPSYQTGEDVAFRWGYRSRYGLRNRSGFGCQRFGEAMGLPPEVEGLFRVQIRDTGDALVREVFTDALDWTYQNADLVADLGGETDFEARLLLRWGKRDSEELSLAIEAV